MEDFKDFKFKTVEFKRENELKLNKKKLLNKKRTLCYKKHKRGRYYNRKKNHLSIKQMRIAMNTMIENGILGIIGAGITITANGYLKKPVNGKTLTMKEASEKLKKLMEDKKCQMKLKKESMKLKMK